MKMPDALRLIAGLDNVMGYRGAVLVSSKIET